MTTTARPRARPGAIVPAPAPPPSAPRAPVPRSRKPIIVPPEVPIITKTDFYSMNGLVKGEPFGSKNAKRPLKFARSHYCKVLERYLIGVLKPTAFTVLLAIHSRTLRWNKVIEIIPIEVFCNGYPGTDDDGLPFFNGLQLNRTTVRTTLDELAAGYFIERFAIHERGRVMHAYMPASGYVMMGLILNAIEMKEVPSAIYDAIYAVNRNPTAHEEVIVSSIPAFWDSVEAPLRSVNPG